MIVPYDHYERVIEMRRALDHLRYARDLLKALGATRALDKVRRALKSAEGADRHLRLAPQREARRARR